MAVSNALQCSRRLMGKLQHGADLLEELTSVCVENSVTLGRIEAIGAVKKARIGFYDQAAREYRFRTFDQPMEITCLAGNISLKDGAPMVHAHITLAKEEGSAVGGHLAPGTIVFACEFVINVLEGRSLEREYDKETGLPLWQL